MRDKLIPKLADAKARLAKLGPPPKEGEVEADGLKEQRKSISDEVGAYDAMIKRADVLAVQASQIVSSFNAKRRLRFVRQLLRPSEGLNQSAFWNEALTSIPRQIDRMVSTTSLAINTRMTATWHWVGLTLLTDRRRRRDDWRHFLSSDAPGCIGDRTRCASAHGAGALVLRRAFALSAPTFALLGVFILTASSFELILSNELLFFATGSLYIGVATFLIAALHFALRPSNPADRLIAIDTPAARQICWILHAIRSGLAVGPDIFPPG